MMNDMPSLNQSTKEKMKQRITKKRRGEILFPEDFKDTGSPEAVRLALHRLEKEGFVKRIAQGIYVRPQRSKYIGEVMPTAEQVAQAIARRDRIKIVPTGVYALHALGLSEQIPMKLVFLTNGAPREIEVGRRTIKLKKTTPKNLMAKGKISSLVIQALREIGKDNVTENLENMLIRLLQEEDAKILKHDIELAPKWIRKIMERGGK